MDAVVTLLLVFAFVIAGSLLLIFISGTLLRRSQTKLETCRKEVDTLNAQRELRYLNDIEPILMQAHQTLCREWKRPDQLLTVDVLAVDSEKELQALQQKLPEHWCAWPTVCSCWVNDHILYILETFDSSEFKAKISPDSYTTFELAKEQIKHLSIPLGSIYYYKAKGDLIHSQRTIAPERISYSGVSVNGIGFGEMKSTPALTLPKIRDTRYIVLYYRVCGKEELQTLYFGYDSLDALVRIIPQYER